MFFTFRNHKHGALSINNTKHITVKNCTFHNNTSDSLFTSGEYQGSAGGFSIGYNFYVTKIPPFNVNNLFAHITNCNFTDNSARLFNGQRGTSDDVLTNNIFPGRGGALSVIVNTYLNLTFIFSDNTVMNNFAEVFGGGVYCITRRSSSQMYTFNNNVFMSNTGLRTGGLALFYITMPMIAVRNDIYNCTFYNNTVSEIAGAITVTTVFEPARNIFVTFKDCNFRNNTAIVYGGAVDIASLNFDYKSLANSFITFINWLVK